VFLHSYEIHKRSQDNAVIKYRSETPQNSATDELREPEFETINVICNRNANISMTPKPAYVATTAVSMITNPACTTSAACEGSDGPEYEGLDKTDHI